MLTAHFLTSLDVHGAILALYITLIIASFINVNDLFFCFK